MLSLGRRQSALMHLAGKQARQRSNLAKVAMRSFGAMDEINRDLFEHKFTSDMTFQSSFDKIKCFRVLDEDGNVVTPGYDN